MNFFTKTLSVVVIVLTVSSCASIVSKSKWPLTINSNPARAKVEITDKRGFVVYTGNTPASMSLKSGAGFFSKQSYKVKFTMDGYNEKIIPLECSLNGWYIGNVVFGGLIGLLIVDPATGAMYRLDTEIIFETLTPTMTSASTTPSLEIIDINNLPESMKGHLVCIE